MDIHSRITFDQKKTFDINDIIYLLIEIVKALVYIHSRKFIHRDLACRNIMITKKDRIKIIDFGMSITCLHDEVIMGEQLKIPLGITPLEGMKTPWRFGFYSDIWSVGMLLIEIIAIRRKNDNIDDEWETIDGYGDMPLWVDEKLFVVDDTDNSEMSVIASLNQYGGFPDGQEKKKTLSFLISILKLCQ